MSIHTSAWSRTRILRGGITATAFLLLVSSITLLAPAEDPPVIVSFSGNGWLAWTNAPGVHGFTVQWASHPSGPWSNNWHGLDNIVTTNTSTMVSVPMFYRVSQSFTPADMRSAWMIVDQFHGHNHFIALEDGIISESSFFIPRAPSGYFTVGTTGVVDLTFITDEEKVQVRGGFADRDHIVLSVPRTGGVIHRVQDESRCMGVWTGLLSQTSFPGAIIHRPIRLEVDSRGLVTNIVGFGDNYIGRLFSLNEGPASGFLYTKGRDPANVDEHDMIHLIGTHTGEKITGFYETEESVEGDANLIRISP